MDIKLLSRHHPVPVLLNWKLIVYNSVLGFGLGQGNPITHLRLCLCVTMLPGRGSVDHNATKECSMCDTSLVELNSQCFQAAG